MAPAPPQAVLLANESWVNIIITCVNMHVPAGLPSSDLQKQRFKAMETMDLGLRLEQAMDFAEDLIARLSAMLSLQS